MKSFGINIQIFTDKSENILYLHSITEKTSKNIFLDYI
jgi:hypothetical protein